MQTGSIAWNALVRLILAPLRLSPPLPSPSCLDMVSCVCFPCRPHFPLLSSPSLVLLQVKPCAQMLWISLIPAEETILASGDDEGVVKLWDIRQRKSVASLEAHDDFVSDLYFSQVSCRLLYLPLSLLPSPRLHGPHSKHQQRYTDPLKDDQPELQALNTQGSRFSAHTPPVHQPGYP